jgi:hypothetical protein
MRRLLLLVAGFTVMQINTGAVSTHEAPKPKDWIGAWIDNDGGAVFTFKKMKVSRISILDTDGEKFVPTSLIKEGAYGYTLTYFVPSTEYNVSFHMTLTNRERIDYTVSNSAGLDHDQREEYFLYRSEP